MGLTIPHYNTITLANFCKHPYFLFHLCNKSSNSNYPLVNKCFILRFYHLNYLKFYFELFNLKIIINFVTSLFLLIFEMYYKFCNSLIHWFVWLGVAFPLNMGGLCLMNSVSPICSGD